MCYFHKIPQNLFLDNSRIIIRCFNVVSGCFRRHQWFCLARETFWAPMCCKKPIAFFSSSLFFIRELYLINLVVCHPEYSGLEQFYMKTGICKFGATCKFHHPKDIQIPLAGQGYDNAVQINSVVDNGETTGDVNVIKTPVSVTPALLHNSKGLPIRPVMLF